jgi:hypothetical protein
VSTQQGYATSLYLVCLRMPVLILRIDHTSAHRQYASLVLQLSSQQTLTSRPSHQASALAPTSALSTFLTSAATQVAYAQLYEASSLLLLLGLLDTLGGVPPQLPLSSTQLAQLTPTVPLQLAAALQRAALVYWLCSSFASAAASSETTHGLGQAPDTQALAQLHLGSVRGSAPRTPAIAPPSGRSISLAAKLLPSLARALPHTSAVLLASSTAAAAVVAALQYGPGDSSDRASSSPSLTDRALQLGLLLFSYQEYPALAGLTRLTSATVSTGGSTTSSTTALAPSAAGPQLLLGLSLACTLKGLQGAERAHTVSLATSCIFRAAAGLDTGGRWSLAAAGTSAKRGMELQSLMCCELQLTISIN